MMRALRILDSPYAPSPDAPSPEPSRGLLSKREQPLPSLCGAGLNRPFKGYFLKYFQ